MTWINVLGMLVWTGLGALLLLILMAVDSIFTKYKDITEIKKGNVAVATRFVMKLFAQGYILSQAMKYNVLWDALMASVVSFIILFVLEMIVRFTLKKTAGLDLDQGTQQGKVAFALIGGSLHIVGALIIAATL